MRRRKKTILGALLTLGAIAALLFWPREHPEARRAFAAVRAMVEIQPDAKSAAAPEVAGEKDPQIEFDIVVAKLNLTAARTRLFAESVPSDTLIVGRVRSPQSILEILQPLDVTSIVGQPRFVARSGQLANVATGGEVEIAPTAVGAPLTYRSADTLVSVRADVTEPGTLQLKINFELPYVARMRTIPTPQGPVEQPDVKTTRASAWGELKAGEALVIGGLTRKAMGRVAFKTPYLSELPGIGSWFCFTRQQEIEEELLVLVAPRIVDPAVMGGTTGSFRGVVRRVPRMQ